MIYRIVAATTSMVADAEGELIEIPGRLAGAFIAAIDGWDDLPMPGHVNPRARFWFTEEGWHRYGRHVVASASVAGRVYRVIRRKNPPEAAVVYRDPWQVAVLPGPRTRYARG